MQEVPHLCPLLLTLSHSESSEQEEPAQTPLEPLWAGPQALRQLHELVRGALMLLLLGVGAAEPTHCSKQRLPVILGLGPKSRPH